MRVGQSCPSLPTSAQTGMDVRQSPLQRPPLGDEELDLVHMLPGNEILDSYELDSALPCSATGLGSMGQLGMLGSMDGALDCLDGDDFFGSQLSDSIFC